MAVLVQDQYRFDEYPIMDVVIMGHKTLYEIMVEKDAIYTKEDFSEEDGMRASDLEARFAEMGGWEAEAEAGRLLNGLGLEDTVLGRKMGDLEAITALNDALIDFKGNPMFVSHDHEFVDPIANRIIKLTFSGIIDRWMRFDDYLANDDVKTRRDHFYRGHHLLEI